MESNLLESLAQYGLPTCLVVVFGWYFFSKHLPAQIASSEQRFKELQETYQKAITYLTESQKKLFEESLHYLVSMLSEKITSGFKEVSTTIDHLQKQIEVREWRPMDGPTEDPQMLCKTSVNQKTPTRGRRKLLDTLE